MPPPPSPVSACQLRRLELNDGSRTSVYEAAQIAGGITLTLDAERSVASRDSLLLSIRCAARDMLSIRISDLLRDPRNIAEAISMSKIDQILTVRAASPKYEVRITFDDCRDFNLSACMLSKCGFAIKEEVTQVASRGSLGQPRDTMADHQYGVVRGPRLSSITPIPGLETNVTSAWPVISLFDTMNQSYPLQHPHTTDPSISSPERRTSTTVSPVMNAPSGVPQRRFSLDEASQLLNPYNVFLSKHDRDLHRPRVASPLRNSFSPRESPEAAWKPDTRIYSNNILDHALPLHRFAQPPSLSSTTTPNRGRAASGVLSHTTASVSSTHEGPKNIPVSTPSRDKGQEQESPTTPSFRDNMPRRRDLPFVKDRGRSLDENDRADPEGPSNNQKQQSPATKVLQSRSRKHERGASDCVRNTVGSEASSGGRDETNSLDDLQQEAMYREEGLAEALELSQKAPGTSVDLSSPKSAFAFEPTVVVAEPRVIRQLDCMTSELLEQYQVDVSRGCDKGVCAQFYLERIHSCRREFWLSQLSGVK